MVILQLTIEGDPGEQGRERPQEADHRHHRRKRGQEQAGLGPVEGPHPQERKGGNDLLNVFLDNFSETCELHLVTNASVEVPEGRNITVYRDLRPMASELLHLYKDADIFVMPTHEDVYGIVFVEAMAAGRPAG